MIGVLPKQVFRSTTSGALIMKLKLLSAAIGIAMGCSLGYTAGAATTTQTTETTVERSSTVDPPKPQSRVIEEKSTTTTKRGILGRRKTETTTSSRSVDVPDRASGSEYRSSTTTETHRDY